MNTRRLRLVRPKWTLGTMLLIVGWSGVVVWLNVRPRVFRRLFALAVWCALSMVCGPASPADYYIAPDKGDDAAAGSLDEPWRHLHHAGRQVKPGDTVFLREGRYVDDYIFTVTDGTEDQPITLTAYREEKPVFTGKGKWEEILILNNSHYVVDGLHFQDTKCLNAVLLNPSSEHSIIRNCTFRNQQSTMIQIRRGGHHVVENCSFDSAGNNEGGGNGDHIYLCGSSHNLVQKNHFVRAGHAVIDVIDFDRTVSTYNIIRDNLIEQRWGGGYTPVACRDSHCSSETQSITSGPASITRRLDFRLPAGTSSCATTSLPRRPSSLAPTTRSRPRLTCGCYNEAKCRANHEYK